ncbi:hypothetical protein INR49_031312, partial [Caranx melampygus]
QTRKFSGGCFVVTDSKHPLFLVAVLEVGRVSGCRSDGTPARVRLHPRTVQYTEWLDVMV